MTVADDARAGGLARLPREERRAQVLRAAREVFVAQGYHTAAMDDIAERAGVSKPVLYQHVPGKLDLYVALLDDGIAVLLDTVRTALEATIIQPPPRERAPLPQRRACLQTDEL